MSTTVRSGLVLVIALVTVLALSLLAEGAQQPVERRQSAPPSAAQGRQGTSVVPIVGDDTNAVQLRQRLYGVLDRYPPGLGRILRLDPTLLRNEEYLSSYPQLLAFLQQNPEIAHNPGYYLERYDPNFRISEPPDARTEAIRLWRSTIEGFGIMTMIIVMILAVLGLIRYLVEYRRWYRLSRAHSEVQNKILDRFGSNQELLAYLETPAGKRLVEAAPRTPDAPQPVAAPISRILLSVQAGIILMVLAIGIRLVSGRAVDEVQPLLNGVAIVGFALGLGFVLSAGASYILSKRMGLLEPSTPPPTSTHAA